MIAYFSKLPSRIRDPRSGLSKRQLENSVCFVGEICILSLNFFWIMSFQYGKQGIETAKALTH